MAEKVFADGFIYKNPREGAPDFVLGSLSIKSTEAIAFLTKHVKEDGWVNLDFLKSKDGKISYFALNDWKPAQEAPAPTVESEQAEVIDDSEIPF